VPEKFVNRKSLIVNRSKFIALFVGEVGLRKGVPYLLQAWSELNLKNAELWLVGAVVPGIKKIVEKYHGREDIKFLGFQRNIPELMTKADIFVFPSIEEGSALVTYEAMAAGLPVVTTTNSGSVVRDGQEGFVLPIRDVEKLKEKIRILYNDRDLRGKMGEAGRRRAEEFTWFNYGENLVKAYEQIINR
jgi:glycosyltransferase involved in cell wall biosynthesis